MGSLKFDVDKMRIVPILLSLFLTSSLAAQHLAGLSTRWDDSFTEWNIVLEEEVQEGEIIMRWAQRNDWSEWDFRVGELSGAIKVKWKGDANLWELRADNEIVTIKTVWKDDFRQWEVKSGNIGFDVESRWSNILEEWSASDKRFGNLIMYTNWEGDLRDWIIEDNLNEQISMPMKIALVFIPVIYSTPKF